MTTANFIFTEELYRIKPADTVVILTTPWPELNPEEKEQLQKISDALRQKINNRLSLDAFQVIYQPQLDINQLPVKPKEVIYFGPAIKGLNYYELIEANQVKMVLAENLANLMKNDQSKQKLWKTLQQLFAA
ncbi:MAG: hypothetical protein WAZ98_01375 [Cyclobacteriaceae bacterium]